MTITIGLELELAGPLVRLVYGFRNAGWARAYVLDELVEPRPEGLVRSRRPVILGGPPGVVRFVLGWVPPPGKVHVFYPPGARALDPGGELSGAREAPWPLASHHPLGSPPPLAPPLTHAVLEVGVLHEAGGWSRLDLGDGEALVAPDLAHAARTQVLVSSAPVPLPSAPAAGPSWTDGIA